MSLQSIHKTGRTILYFIIASSLVNLCCAGELAEMYDKAHPEIKKQGVPGLSPGGRVSPEYAGDQTHITEIAIEHAGSFWKCPEYVVTIQSAGVVRYVGGENARPKGTRTGRISDRYFLLLAEFIRDSGFMQMKDAYYASITDQETVFTSIVVNGKRKIILNYARSGPSALWAIQALIDRLAASTKWETAPGQSRPEFPEPCAK